MRLAQQKRLSQKLEGANTLGPQVLQSCRGRVTRVQQGVCPMIETNYTRVLSVLITTTILTLEGDRIHQISPRGCPWWVTLNIALSRRLDSWLLCARKYDIIHKTGSTSRIVTQPNTDRAMITENVPKIWWSLNGWFLRCRYTHTHRQTYMYRHGDRNTTHCCRLRSTDTGTLYKNIRISTDILWRVFRIVTEPIPYFILCIRKSTE